MATEQLQKVEIESPVVPAPVPEKVVSVPKVEEKPVVAPVDDAKALAVVEKIPDSAEKKDHKVSYDRDVALADLEKEKRLSFIKAWEESEKSKVENKTQKQLAAVNSWENTQKAKIEAKLKKMEDPDEVYTSNSQWCTTYVPLKFINSSFVFTLGADKFRSEQEELEKKKAAYAEQMKNKTAMVHKAAEEKRAMVEAKRGEDLLKAEEMAAKHRATGYVPKKFLGCFGG